MSKIKSMSNIDWFKFEDREYDFPWYRHNPRVSKLGWIVLFFSIFVAFILYAIPDSEMFASILFCIALLVPVLYFLDWDIKAIIRKPTSKQVGLAVLLFVGYIIYALVMGEILEILNLAGSDVVSVDMITLESLFSLIFAMMGEEMIKLIPFLFFLRLFYKYSDNRKLSVIVSVLFVMVFFGLMHAMDFESIPSVLLLQGAGSIFEFYGYIKTKNVMVSYITHLCTDAFIYLIILAGL